MKIKLKDCPFCGARPFVACESVTAFVTHQKQVFYEVKCTECPASLDRWFDSEQEAAEAWNKRAEHMGYWIKKNGIYQCTECGAWFPHWSAYCRDCGAKMDEDASV